MYSKENNENYKTKKFRDIPNEIIWEIFQFLPAFDLFNTIMSSKRFELISSNDNFWKFLFLNLFKSRKSLFSCINQASKINLKKEKKISFKRRYFFFSMIPKVESWRMNVHQPFLKQFKDNNMFDDKIFILGCLHRCSYHVLDFVEKKFKNDRNIIMEAVKLNGFALKTLSKDNILRNDKELILEAVKANGSSFCEASNELKNDEKFVKRVVKIAGYALREAGTEIKKNKNVVLEAVKKYGCALEFCSEKLRNDNKVVFLAVKSDGWALQFASQELRNKKKIVFEESGQVFKFASYELRNDIEFAVKVVKRNPYALKYVSNELQRNIEFTDLVKNKKLELDPYYFY